MAAAYPLAWRERARDLWLAGWSQQQIALELAVSAHTVRRWLRQWRQTGSLAIGRSPGRARLLGVAAEPALAAQLRRHPNATLVCHCQLWEAAHGVRVSPATMCRAIQRLGWTRQRQPPGRLP
jgi:transposase